MNLLPGLGEIRSVGCPCRSLSDPVHRLLARSASDHAANLLRQAARRCRNPVVGLIRRLTPEQDAARFAAYQSAREEASSPT